MAVENSELYKELADEYTAHSKHASERGDTFVVFDLVDTLAITDHRQHILEMSFDSESERWNTFFDACDRDVPNEPLVTFIDDVIYRLWKNGYRFEIWTGRSDRVREKTEEWLRNNLSMHNFVELRMREEGDYRHDTEVKAEWIKEYGKPDIVFDDRNSVVKWWREQGVTCLQVKESNF